MKITIFFTLLGLLTGILTYRITQSYLSILIKHNDSFSANLSAYASVIIGFLLMGFTVLFSYSDKAAFKGWKNSGHFNTWIIIYIFALLSNVIVLFFSFLILVQPILIPFALGFFVTSITFTILVFAPIFFSVYRV